MPLDPAWNDRKWKSLDLIAFDTETTGKYPLTAEVCELAAVKWRDGQIIETFQTLLKPSKPMDAEVIAIHGITNDMVEDAPLMADRIRAFHAFVQNGVMIAHHAPFDLGFVALEFEKAGLELPTAPALCSSLLSRKLFPESANHRLQTLIPFFGIEQGTAHRALDDAKACLEVGLRCLQKLGDEATLQAAFTQQSGSLTWERFAMLEMRADQALRALIQGSREQKVVEMVYGAGSSPGKPRRVHPLGIVRSLDGDFVVAYDEKDQRSKRYLLEKVLSATVV